MANDIQISYILETWTKLIGKVEGILDKEEPPEHLVLTPVQVSLKEKLKSEILGLVEEDALVEEIGQADLYKVKERVHSALIRIEEAG